MALLTILPILRYPDPRLHTVARPVAVVDEPIRQLGDHPVTVRLHRDVNALITVQVVRED